MEDGMGKAFRVPTDRLSQCVNGGPLNQLRFIV